MLEEASQKSWEYSPSRVRVWLSTQRVKEKSSLLENIKVTSYHVATDKMSAALVKELNSRKDPWVSEQERSLNDSQSVIIEVGMAWVRRWGQYSSKSCHSLYRCQIQINSCLVRRVFIQKDFCSKENDHKVCRYLRIKPKKTLLLYVEMNSASRIFVGK